MQWRHPGRSPLIAFDTFLRAKRFCYMRVAWISQVYNWAGALARKRWIGTDMPAHRIMFARDTAWWKKAQCMLCPAPYSSDQYGMLPRYRRIFANRGRDWLNKRCPWTRLGGAGSFPGRLASQVKVLLPEGVREVRGPSSVAECRGHGSIGATVWSGDAKS